MSVDFGSSLVSEQVCQDLQLESADLGCKRTTMGEASKQEWLQELEEINQSIRVENVEFRRLLHISEDEKRKLQLQLQAKAIKVLECRRIKETILHTRYGNCL
jgi:hypothetical protein